VHREGLGGRTTSSQSLVTASQRVGPVYSQTWLLLMRQPAYQDDGPAERTGSYTPGPTTQHTTKLARASTAIMHDKYMMECYFHGKRFASLHGDLDFSNICQIMASATLNIAKARKWRGGGRVQSSHCPRQSRHKETM
jgi:hypothetical protein